MAPNNLKKRDGLDTNRNRSLYDDILVFMLQKRIGAYADNPKNSRSVARHV